MPVPDVNYTAYTVSEFIADSFFQRWIIAPDEETAAFWQAFIAAHPEKEEAVSEARNLLLKIRFREDMPDDAVIRRRFAEHLSQIKAKDTGRVVWLPKRTIMAAAKVAAVLLLVFTGYLFFFDEREKQLLVATQFGERKELILPDSSLVVLNANSSIRYSNWDKEESREIWLDGEAYFDVKHVAESNGTKRKFLVHGKDVTIEVVGTSFNVRQRRGTTEVVLETGIIRLVAPKKVVVMKPGDLVVYDAKEDQVTQSVTAARDYVTWKEDKLVLSNPTVEEIFQYLEDNFGKRIVLEDASLKNKRIEGPILINNLDDALFVISTVLNADIQKYDSLLIVRPK